MLAAFLYTLRARAPSLLSGPPFLKSYMLSYSYVGRSSSARGDRLGFDDGRVGDRDMEP